MIFFVIAGILLAVGLIALSYFFILRRSKRNKINLQRGLSMTTLLIHLPPYSEDKSDVNRDERDVVEENISQASILYNLLTSVYEKENFKTKYYGQKHISLEIVAQADKVYFYAVTPLDLVETIRQAIGSTYRGAKLEEVDDYNLFSDKSNWQTVKAGQLVLREHFAYPIATYLKTKQDIMRAILGAFTNLEAGCGVGIQLLIRPAGADWTKEAKTKVKSISDSKKDNFLKELALGFVRSPEAEAKSSEPSEISGLDRSKIEAIEDKLTKPGFEVLVRVLVSTDNLIKSEMIYRNIFAGFKLVDDAQNNGFKLEDSKDVNQFIKDFSLRVFPQKANKDILNITELATIFHIPNQSNIPTSQLERQAAKQVDGPRNFPKEGALLGHNVYRDTQRSVMISSEDRMRHMYVAGQTGTGKSVFLENLALQDMQAGKGFAFVDPHGETAEKILRYIPKHRLNDVIYFNPGNLDYPMGLNIFEYDTVDQQDFLIQEAISILYKLYDPQRQGIIGPRYEYMFRNAAKLIMADPRGGSFIDIPNLFNDRSVVEDKLKYVKDQTLIDFWRKEIIDASRSSEFGDMKSWFVSKFSAFLSNAMMRNIIGQTKSSFNLRQIMDQGKIMIINLSMGTTGELNTNLLGMLFVTKFQMAAMSRADIAESERRDFTLYIDEFQNFATDSFAVILSAARKYRLALVVANQHVSQLKEEIRDSIYGNVGTAVSFRINATDAENMVKQFYSPTFSIDDLTRLPLGNAVVRTLIDGVPTIPFNVATLPPVQLAEAKYALADIEKNLLQRTTRSRSEIEKEIFQRLKVTSPSRPANLPSKPVFNTMPKPPMPPLSPQKNSSFVEEWLKRKKATQLENIEKKNQYFKEEIDKQQKLQAELSKDIDSKSNHSD